MMLSRNVRAAVLTTLLLALTLAACVNSDPPTDSPNGPSAATQISIDWNDPSVPADARSIRVSATSLDTPERAPTHLVLNHPTTSGSIDAPVGHTRFTIRAYAQPNASGALLHTTQRDMLVIAGHSNTLHVTFPDTTRVTSLSLTLSTTTLRPGGSAYATATARDEHGAIIPDIAVTWTSTTPTIASIDDAGIITAHADGQTTITATEPTTSLTASATLTVTTATTTVARLELGPGSGSLPVGARLRFRTEAFDADDQLASDAAITFTSSDPTVMSVTGTGDATALSVGTATIRATADGVTATATLSVTPASSATAGASWSPVRPPVSQAVSAFDVRGDTMVASTSRVDAYTPRAHLLTSDDAGTTWRPIYSGSLLDLGCNQLDSLTIDPASHTTLLATCGGFNDPRLLRSVDGGVRWVVVSQVASGQHPPATFHEADPRFVTSGDTLHSHDRGVTWTPSSTLFTRWVSPTDPNHWIDYAPSDPTATRISYDAGATWTSASLPPRPDRGDERCTNDWSWQHRAVSDTGTILALGRHYCFQLPSDERNLFVLYASSDLQSWTPRYVETTSSASIALSSRTLVVSPADDMVLYAFPSTVSPSAPLYVSQDGGATWSEHTSPVNLSASTRLLSSHLPNALMLRATVSATSTRYVSHDYGATWTSATLGGRYPLIHQREHNAYAFPSDGSSDQPLVTSSFFQTTDTLPGLGLTTSTAPPSLVPTQTPHAIRSHSLNWTALQGHYSADRGITWTRTDTPSLLAAQSPANPNTWYFATYRGDVHRSSDNAATYTYAGTLQNYEFALGFALSHADPNRLYAFNNGGVYRSDNGGQRWRWASTNLTSVWVSDLIVDPTNHDVLYAATLYGIHKSVNGGDDWTLSSAGFPTIVESTVLAITSDGSTVFAGTASGSIYRSLDAGATWEWVNRGFESYRVRDLLVDPNDDNVIYAGTHGGVYKSVDKGSSWTLASAGMFSPFVDWLAIAADSSTLYAGTTDHGIYRGAPSNDTGAAFPTAVAALFAPPAPDNPTPR